MSLNSIALSLPPYPMEELAKIRAELIRQGKKVYDFGTGDPRIPVWKPIREALAKGITEISQYPSIKGTQAMTDAYLGYLKVRFGIQNSKEIAVLPTQGSKEAIFHVALCIIGRAGGKKHLIYPDPGYPVYRSSALFAGGIPYPVEVTKEAGYLLEPWKLPENIQKDAAAIWVNYPHNPTGAIAPLDYWEKLIAWGHRTNTIILSDDCYVDIYPPELDNITFTSLKDDPRPLIPLQLATKGIITFMSLSKRSGMTGYRAGFMAGDPELINNMQKARANFGVGIPDFIQQAATVAWNDESHVAERRKIFAKRIALSLPVLKELGMLEEAPPATFYLWAKIPKGFQGDDVKFCLELAKEGVISSPSQWLSEGIKGFVRFALVPTEEDTNESFEILRKFVGKI